MMTIVFLVVWGVILILLLISKKKYQEFVAPLDKTEFKLKTFVPMGLFLLDSAHYTFSTKYDRDMLNKITELHGAKYAMYYLKIHWANKLAFMLLGMGFMALLGVSMKPDATFLVFSILCIGGIFFLSDYEVKNKVEKRRLSIRIEFPDFINKLTLLINAGLTVQRAWEKIVNENKKNTILYEEVSLVMAEIKGGKPEGTAYEDFAKRCKTPEITKFIAVVIQNLKKGNSELVNVLKFQGRDCWEMRKNAAKKIGEEASTKMLFPMMIMFLAVLLIVVTPAVLSLQGI